MNSITARRQALEAVSRITLTLGGLGLGTLGFAGCIEDPMAAPEATAELPQVDLGEALQAAADATNAQDDVDRVALEDVSVDPPDDILDGSLPDALAADEDPDAAPAVDASAADTSAPDAALADAAGACAAGDDWAACCEANGWDWDAGCMAWGPPVPPGMPGEPATVRA